MSQDKEKTAARHKAWREANKARKAATSKAWYEANKDKVAANHKVWSEANKEKISARHKAWREANNARKAATSKAWNEANKALLAIKKLSKSKIAHLMGMKTADCPEELITAKRELLAIFRLTKQLNQLLKDKENGTK